MNQPLSGIEIGGIVLIVVTMLRVGEGFFSKMLEIIARRRNNKNGGSTYVSKDLCEEKHGTIGRDIMEIKGDVKSLMEQTLKCGRGGE